MGGGSVEGRGVSDSCIWSEGYGRLRTVVALW